MSLLGKIAKGVVDVVKTAAVIPNASYKTITGKDLVKIDYDTKVGSTLGGINKVGIDTGHTALQKFANNVTGGYASKLHEEIVPGIKEKQMIEQNTKNFSGGVLSKFEDNAMKYAPVVGDLGVSVLKPKPKPGAPKPATVLPGKPVSGLVNQLIKTDQPVSLLSTISAGANTLNNISKTPIGQAATGILGGVVMNLVNKKTGTPSTVPQQVALATGKSPAIAEASKLTSVQQAVFGGKGITINDQGITTGTWWDRNKSWMLPVCLAVPGLIITIILLFRRKR